MTRQRGRPDEITEAYYHGLMQAMGYRAKDLDKALVSVVNSWPDVSGGHSLPKELSVPFKEGIGAAGGSPGECDVLPPATGRPEAGLTVVGD